jgi:hypothetical protein
MKKLNIQTLTGRQVDNTKNISVGTLSEVKRDTGDIHTEDILNSIKYKREKKKEIYMRNYYVIFEQIRILNNSNKTDLIYDIPSTSHEITDYDPEECCKFLEEKLKEKCLDVLILDNKTSLFITWKYLEINKDKKKKTS